MGADGLELAPARSGPVPRGDGRGTLLKTGPRPRQPSPPRPLWSLPPLPLADLGLPPWTPLRCGCREGPSPGPLPCPGENCISVEIGGLSWGGSARAPPRATDPRGFRSQCRCRDRGGVLALPVPRSRVRGTAASAWRSGYRGGAPDSPKPSTHGPDRQRGPCHLSLTHASGGPPGAAPAGKPTAPLCALPDSQRPGRERKANLPFCSPRRHSPWHPEGKGLLRSGNKDRGPVTRQVLESGILFNVIS